jgi:hypothetical protein
MSFPGRLPRGTGARTEVASSAITAAGERFS